MEIRFLADLIIVFGGINLLRMASFLIGSDIYGVLLAKRKKHTKPFYPKISVIIPAHNEQEAIRSSIVSVLKNNYPVEKIQIIVVDDGSTDDTVKQVRQLMKIYLGRIKLIQQANAGKAHALNRGLKETAGSELVMCLDSDSALAPDALQNAAAHFKNPKVSALSANVKIVKQPGLLNFVQRYEYLVCYQMKRAESLFNCEYIVGGIGSVFRRSVLTKVGGYDTNTVTEDIDLTMKVLQLGNKNHRAVYGADVIAYTGSVLSISGLINQRFRWKWGRCQTFLKNTNLFLNWDKKHTKSLTWFYLPFALYGDLAYLVEPVLLSYIIAICIRYHDLWTLLSSWLVITTYLCFNIIAEDTLAWREKFTYLLGAPAVYFLLYILSFVEYVALIKSLVKLPTLKDSLDENNCGWTHVSRSALAAA